MKKLYHWDWHINKNSLWYHVSQTEHQKVIPEGSSTSTFSTKIDRSTLIGLSYALKDRQIMFKVDFLSPIISQHSMSWRYHVLSFHCESSACMVSWASCMNSNVSIKPCSSDQAFTNASFPFLTQYYRDDALVLCS